MNLEQFLQKKRGDPAFMASVTHWERVEPKPARFSDFSARLAEPLKRALNRRGIYQLYSHQRQALDAVFAGKHLTVVTPTASGKSLCYTLPSLQAMLEDKAARALFIFPTKALAADQVAELNAFIGLLDEAGDGIKAFTYDGDTAVNARNAVRAAGNIVVTNPDMLHAAILPGHLNWVKLFENLKFVVIDELHVYRGVFGSNMANVIRRLRRLCAFYGSNPQFICCSATIANPGELAAQIIGEKTALIDENGAPSGEKNLVFYNPPVVNRQLGIRESSLSHARRLAGELLQNGIHSITFARSRLNVEVLTTYLKRLVADVLGNSDAVRGYRGGYLPNLRREIERGLRSGEVRAVVSTNALELGIDIGQLEACVLCGYPGSVASTWQQAGRAGRRHGSSATFLVASSAPLDQYIVNHPEYFLDQSPEHASINPGNLFVLLNHLKCAAYELPFAQGELFGDAPATGEMLRYLEEENILHLSGGRYHWMADDFPSAEVSLRSAFDENFLIIDISDPAHHEVIGEMDRYTVPMLLHERAIYLHNAQQYQVESLDFDDKKAYIRKVDVDYYTDADLTVNLRVLDVFRTRGALSLGEVLVTSIVSVFKKMKFDTHENLGFGEVNLPELEMHSSAMWLTVEEGVFAGLGREEAGDAMLGLSYALGTIAPLYLMCATWDIRVSFHVRDSFTKKPTLYITDGIPGGIGLADKAFEMMEVLLGHAAETIEGCPCEEGCPSCLGSPYGKDGKKNALLLAKRLSNELS
ncbi:MAG: DEAD/DEAH box helicase [Christensenellaceae bacterium]|nr:DEAD/DEAH box helicase [Christensenellaceae bacterium]